MTMHDRWLKFDNGLEPHACLADEHTLLTSRFMGGYLPTLSMTITCEAHHGESDNSRGRNARIIWSPRETCATWNLAGGRRSVGRVNQRERTSRRREHLLGVAMQTLAFRFTDAHERDGQLSARLLGEPTAPAA